MRYDAEHKQRTRERVLRVAAKAIRAEGPHRVGVAGVMKKAGLTHGGFYAHFASKEAMIVAAFGEMFDESFAQFHTITADRAPADALRKYVRVYLSPEHRDARASGCPIAALLADLPRMTAGCRRAFASGMRRLTSEIATSLAQLERDDPETLASSMIAEMVGALSLARVEPDKARSDAILAASREVLIQRLQLEKKV